MTTSSAVEGQQAFALAGLAVIVLIEHMVVPGLRTVGADEGFPELPDTGLLLVKSPDARQPETNALASIIVETFKSMDGRA